MCSIKLGDCFLSFAPHSILVFITNSITSHHQRTSNKSGAIGSKLTVLGLEKIPLIRIIPASSLWKKMMSLSLTLCSPALLLWNCWLFMLPSFHVQDLRLKHVKTWITTPQYWVGKMDEKWILQKKMRPRHSLLGHIQGGQLQHFCPSTCLPFVVTQKDMCFCFWGYQVPYLNIFTIPGKRDTV